MDSLPHFVQDRIAGFLRIADAGFKLGRVETTSRAREAHWRNWESYCQSVGLDPYLQGVEYHRLCKHVQSFAGAIRCGYYGQGRTVRSSTVSTALAAVNTTIALAINKQPLKVSGTKAWLPKIQMTLDGWEKEDPPTEKKMPVEVDVPEYLVKCGLMPGASQLVRCIGDWVLIAFYFLLRIGEYTKKGSRNETKQTVQFRMRNVTFFKRDKRGSLRQVNRDAEDGIILTADAATLTLENQKNGWKGVSISHHSNGLEAFDPVRALGRRYCHIRQHCKDGDTLLSAYFDENGRKDLRDKDVRQALKVAASVLDYPQTRGIPIDKIDTHSCRIGGANAMSLAGYSKSEIQKLGRWRGQTFLEYIRESLADFSKGMSEKMSKCFGFVSLEGGVYHDVTDTVLASEYSA